MFSTMNGYSQKRFLPQTTTDYFMNIFPYKRFSREHLLLWPYTLNVFSHERSSRVSLASRTMNDFFPQRFLSRTFHQVL